jgi:hypothetical protein
MCIFTKRIFPSAIQLLHLSGSSSITSSILINDIYLVVCISFNCDWQNDVENWLLLFIASLFMSTCCIENPSKDISYAGGNYLCCFKCYDYIIWLLNQCNQNHKLCRFQSLEQFAFRIANLWIVWDRSQALNWWDWRVSAILVPILPFFCLAT